MTSLQETVVQEAAALSNARASISSKQSLVHPDTFELWNRRFELKDALLHTIPLIEFREKAWNAVRHVESTTKIDPGQAPKALFYNTEVTCEIARHLALVSYISTCWCIYDRLANVCGRIAGHDDRKDSPNQHPKLYEDILGRKLHLGFSTHSHVMNNYAWPIKVSYKLRNWMIHDGFRDSSNNTSLFSGSSGFELHRDAKRIIDQQISKDSEQKTYPAQSQPPWNSSNPDLLQALPQYHGEIDAMFAGLVKWCVGAYVSQVCVFTEQWAPPPRLPT